MKLSKKLYHLASYLKLTSTRKWHQVWRLLSIGDPDQEIRAAAGVSQDFIDLVRKKMNTHKPGIEISRSQDSKYERDPEPDLSTEQIIIKMRAEQLEPGIIAKQLKINIEDVENFLDEIKDRLQNENPTTIALEYRLPEEMLESLQLEFESEDLF